MFHLFHAPDWRALLALKGSQPFMALPMSQTLRRSARSPRKKAYNAILSASMLAPFSNSEKCPAPLLTFSSANRLLLMLRTLGPIPATSSAQHRVLLAATFAGHGGLRVGLKSSHGPVVEACSNAGTLLWMELQVGHWKKHRQPAP